MATTEDAIVDRARDVLEALGHTEAVGFDFSKTPATAIDRAFIVRYEAQAPIGGFSLSEEARGTIEVDLARLVNNDYQATRREAWQQARAIVNALVEDGSTSGIYAVEDGSRTTTVLQPVDAAYLIARARVPVNFDATL